MRAAAGLLEELQIMYSIRGERHLTELEIDCPATKAHVRFVSGMPPTSRSEVIGVPNAGCRTINTCRRVGPAA